MGDPDIQNVFKKSYSLEDLTLEDASLDVTDNTGEMVSKSYILRTTFSRYVQIYWVYNHDNSVIKIY